MKLVFSETAWTDYLYSQEHDKKLVKRIHELIKECKRHPHTGIGKPEPLRHALAGWWSRRINDEHRMVYRVSDDELHLAQLRYHYEG